MHALHGRCSWALWLLLAVTPSASAQTDAPLRQDPGHAVGVRAAGMGGAFTAVADDGSAAFWNPAGFASGSFFSLVADANMLDQRQSTLVALGTPPLGLSYYRTAIVAEKNGRNTLVAHHAGVTLVQSLGGHLAVGTTLKLVHGIASPAGSAAISTNKFDADLGFMSTGSIAQVGLSVRNLLQPEFRTAGGGAIRLDRQVRAGVAIHAGQNVTVAGDVDLTTAVSPRGRWRDAALGVEVHPAVKAWLRGGVHWNAARLRRGASAGQAGGAGGAAPIGTVGGSYAVYGAVQAEAQASFGSADGDRGWGVGLRFVF
jgi:hypothetical protein